MLFIFYFLFFLKVLSFLLLLLLFSIFLELVYVNMIYILLRCYLSSIFLASAAEPPTDKPLPNGECSTNITVLIGSVSSLYINYLKVCHLIHSLNIELLCNLILLYHNYILISWGQCLV